MLTARLQYAWPTGQELQYSRAFKLTTPEQSCGLLSRQIWTVVADKEDFHVLQIEEEVLQRVGGLGDPPERRRIFVDALGAIPEREDQATIWPLVNWPEDNLEVGDGWTNSEILPNSPEPIDVDYEVADLALGESDLEALLVSRGQLAGGHLEGRYRFSVPRGVLLEAALTIHHQNMELVIHSKLLNDR